MNRDVGHGMPAFGLSPERLWRVLEHHRGRDRAIRARELTMVLGLTDWDPNRVIQHAVNALIDAGYAVGSVTGNGTTVAGYFVIETEAEFEEAVGQLNNRVRELQRRIVALTEAYRSGPRQRAFFALPAPPRPRTGPVHGHVSPLWAWQEPAA